MDTVQIDRIQVKLDTQQLQLIIELTMTFMKICILIVITILSITLSCCHSKRIIKPSFVSAEEEKEIMLDVAKQAEIYTNELGEM